MAEHLILRRTDMQCSVNLYILDFL